MDVSALEPFVRPLADGVATYESAAQELFALAAITLALGVTYRSCC